MKFNLQSTQMLKDGIEKKSIKKGQKTQVNRVNLQNPQFESWDHDNLIKIKLKQIIKFIPQWTQTFKDKIERKNTLHKRIKKLELELTCKIYD